MKKYNSFFRLLTVAIVCVLCFQTQHVFGQYSSVEELGKALLSALKNNDQTPVLSMGFGMQDVDAIYEGEAVTPEEKEMLKKEIKKNGDKVFKDLQGRLIYSFESARKLEGIEGFKWSKAKYLACKDDTETHGKGNIIRGNVYITFKMKKHKYILLIDQALQVPRGWIITDDGFRVYKKDPNAESSGDK